MKMIKSTDVKLSIDDPIIIGMPDALNEDMFNCCDQFKRDHAIFVGIAKGSNVREIMSSIDWYYHHTVNDRYRVFLFNSNVVDDLSLITQRYHVHMLSTPNIPVDRSSLPDSRDITIIESRNNGISDIIMWEFRWRKFPVLEGKERVISALKEEIQHAFRMRKALPGDYSMGLDSHGRLINRYNRQIFDFSNIEEIERLATKLQVSMREIRFIAYMGLDFVTLDKEDARAVADLMDDVVEERGGDDVNAFGDKGISYERLHDRLTGLLYPADVTLVKKSVEYRSDAAGYHMTTDTEPLVLESPALDCDHKWTAEEWDTICKMCGLPADKTSRIVLNINTMEYFIEKNKKGEQ